MMRGIAGGMASLFLLGMFAGVCFSVGCGAVGYYALRVGGSPDAAG